MCASAATGETAGTGQGRALLARALGAHTEPACCCLLYVVVAACGGRCKCGPQTGHLLALLCFEVQPIALLMGCVDVAMGSEPRVRRLKLEATAMCGPCSAPGPHTPENARNTFVAAANGGHNSLCMGAVGRQALNSYPPRARTPSPKLSTPTQPHPTPWAAKPVPRRPRRVTPACVRPTGASAAFMASRGMGCGASWRQSLRL